ncbi:MAG TPA: AbrB/MazE/SpoVT family DNA-binding domain-containing protein [Thermoanaerobaculia bacterium]|nr:AbrB/MazE/SpoVT family DNA-binding domain-containing protein [Thermoanaerobaculia bacterium]
MLTSILTSNGRITLPKAVRERLGLRNGDVLEFRFDERGRVVLRPVAASALDRVSGVLRHLAKERPVTVKEMRQAVMRRARDKQR